MIGGEWSFERSNRIRNYGTERRIVKKGESNGSEGGKEAMNLSALTIQRIRYF